MLAGFELTATAPLDDRVGELPRGVGELLLVTFAEVSRDKVALRQHRLPRCVRSVHPDGAWNNRASRFPKGRGAVWRDVASLLHPSEDSETFVGRPRPDGGSVVDDAAGFPVLGAEQKSGVLKRDRSSSSQAAARPITTAFPSKRQTLCLPASTVSASIAVNRTIALWRSSTAGALARPEYGISSWQT